MPSKSVLGDLPDPLLEAICAVIKYCRQLLIRDRPAGSFINNAVIVYPGKDLQLQLEIFLKLSFQMLSAGVSIFVVDINGVLSRVKNIRN